MKITFDREKLLTALAMAAASEDPRSQGKIDVDPLGTTKISARSLRTIIGTEVEARGVVCNEAGALYTSLAKLAAILGASSAEEGLLTVDGAKAMLKIGRSNMKLGVGQRETSVPLEFPTDPKASFTVPVGGFLKATSRVLPAIDAARADALAGAFCYVEEGGERMFFVGATGAHLTEASCPLSAKAEKAAKAVLPVTALQQFAKVTTGTADAIVEFYGTGVVYRQDAARILAPVLISEYVDYKRIIPPRSASFAVISAAELQETLRRIAIVDEQRVGMRVTCNAGPGSPELLFRLGTGDEPTFEDSIPILQGAGTADVWYRHEDFQYLLTGVKDGKLRLEFNGETKPLAATFEGDDAYLTVTTPMNDQRPGATA